ncbi:hypothetical protein AWJ20_3068 [Sugiyamaella lignohabitans]|uniref:Uncharacterized protein n=1 Tax=Sugiyamaella lignohabitans TaxID=796027 RepID=A0A161HHF1_9ASCO|nr:uncharacterized protein AWJ20_3068 [Sugiyamaella lignohabitans]ANB15440.1 hypothetical protein AWJ20_3068 [Sugiyamaella lignohabitans]
MADPTKTFFQGLKKFKHLILFANAVHDRTVPFYTAYISLKDPFQKRDFIEYEYFHYAHNDDFILKYDDQGVLKPVSDMFVNMEGSKFVSYNTGVETKATKQERQFQAFALFTLPWVFPIVFAITSVTTIVSHYKVREARKANATLAIDYLGEEDSSQAGSPSHVHERSEHPEPSSRLSKWAGNAMDEVLAADGEEVQQADSVRSSVEPESDSTTDVEEPLKGELTVKPCLGDGTKGLLASTPHSLPLSPNVQKLAESLNTLHWEKYAVKLERMHSHAEIVNRRNKPGQGQRVVAFWVELVHSKLNNAT